MNRADVRVVQGGSRSRLPLETAERLAISSHLLGEELERHEPVQAAILGLIDHAHPATAQLLDDAVVRDGLADEGAEGFYGLAVLPESERPRGHLQSRTLQEAACLLLCR